MSSASRSRRARSPSPSSSESSSSEQSRGASRNLRPRPSSGNTNDTSAVAGPSSDPSPTPSRKRLRAAQRPEIMQLIQASPAYIFFADLVDTLFARPEADGFRKPVLDLWTEEAVPGYLETIETPMDLGTIKTRLKEGEYNRYHPDTPFLDEDSVMRDIVLTFNNCIVYNEPHSDFHKKAQVLLKLAKKEFKPRMIARKREEERKEQMRKEKRLHMDRERRARVKREKEEAERKKQLKREKDQQRRALKKQAEEQARREEEAREKMLREKREKERIARAERKRISQAVVEARVAETRRMANGLDGVDEFGIPRKRQRPSGDTNGYHYPSAAPPQKVAKTSDSNGLPPGIINSEEAARIESELELVNGEEVRDLHITFVSTKNMEKRRGRKSVAVMQLELRHEQLMKQRRVIVNTKIELDRRRQIEMPLEEKVELCKKMSGLDFIQMREVCRIIAVGTDQPELMKEVEVDVDLENMDNRLLREIQVFLENPTVSKCQASLRAIESELADIEQNYVMHRYRACGK